MFSFSLPDSIILTHQDMIDIVAASREYVRQNTITDEEIEEFFAPLTLEINEHDIREVLGLV
jgi:hypothetical protein